MDILTEVGLARNSVIRMPADASFDVELNLII